MSSWPGDHIATMRCATWFGEAWSKMGHWTLLKSSPQMWIAFTGNSRGNESKKAADRARRGIESFQCENPLAYWVHLGLNLVSWIKMTSNLSVLNRVLVRLAERELIFTKEIRSRHWSTVILMLWWLGGGHQASFWIRWHSSPFPGKRDRVFSVRKESNSSWR